MFFTANANAGAATCGARLPNTKSLIERIEVSMGGVVLSQGTNFTNVLSAAKQALQEQYCDATLGHPQYIRQRSYSTVSGVQTAGVSNPTIYAAQANENEPQQYCIDDWEGFLSTAQPSLFDTSIVPMIKIRLYMAANEVLSITNSVTLGQAAGAFSDVTGTWANAPIGLSGPTPAGTAPVTGARYVVNNIFFTIECVSLADMAYENMLAAQMSSQSFLEVPYKAYYTFLDTHTGSTKFSVASSSMDRVWLAWRGANYNTQNNPVTVSGYKVAGGFTSATAGAATALDQGVPQYDRGGVLDTNEEKYLGRYFNFSQPNTFGAGNGAVPWTLQLQLNGAYMPQFQARAEGLYEITRNSLEYTKKSKLMTYDQYLNNYCVQCFRLNLPDSEFSRKLTGIDTRSSNLSGIVSTTGTLTSSQPSLTVFVECSEILRIGMGRAINVVV